MSCHCPVCVRLSHSIKDYLLTLRCLLHAGLADPDAKDNCLLALVRQLPKPNFDTTVFLLNHLIRSHIWRTSGRGLKGRGVDFWGESCTPSPPARGLENTVNSPSACDSGWSLADKQFYGNLRLSKPAWWYHFTNLLIIILNTTVIISCFWTAIVELITKFILSKLLVRWLPSLPSVTLRCIYSYLCVFALFVI